ncbi:MAG: hypothetical protein NZ936_07095, partial [Alphaproteobacteria bacterium]|nr:hypothetical protein [Alphaproteobacteria bacterium]
PSDKVALLPLGVGPHVVGMQIIGIGNGRDTGYCHRLIKRTIPLLSVTGNAETRSRRSVETYGIS